MPVCVCTAVLDDSTQYISPSGNALCATCFETNFLYCRGCRQTQSRVDSSEVTFENGSTGTVCSYCAPRYVFQCRNCQQHFPRFTGEAHGAPDGFFYCGDCYSLITLSCGSCHEPIMRTQAQFIRVSGESVAFCLSCHRRQASQQLSTTFDRNPFTRKVGFELEFVLPFISGVHLADLGYLKTDGSVGPRDLQKGRPYEFASCISNGDRLLDVIADVSRRLRRAKAFVNPSCGFHVHLDMNGTTTAQRTNLIRWWHAYESILFSFVPYNRHGSQYCQPIAVVGRERHLRNRYCALNVTALQKWGTFEVRLHSGTTDREKITNWILFLLTFFTLQGTPITDAECVAIRQLRARDRLISLFRVLHLSTPMRKYLIGRARKFAHYNFSKRTVSDPVAQEAE